MNQQQNKTCQNLELGHVVWHDLFTPDVAKAKSFYADLFGWEYQIEHADDFAWESGEADYPLIISNGEAHGGFVKSQQDGLSGWLAYVRVEDVDVAAAGAKKLGAKIYREPFNVTGVGRSAVIQDPENTFMGLYVPTHSFPAPSGIFLWDELNTDKIETTKVFYSELFRWKISDVAMNESDSYITFRGADNTATASIINQRFGSASSSDWVTYFAANDFDVTLAKAKTLGAIVYLTEDGRLSSQRSAILADPMGAVFGLLGTVNK